MPGVAAAAWSPGEHGRRNRGLRQSVDHDLVNRMFILHAAPIRSGREGMGTTFRWCLP